MGALHSTEIGHSALKNTSMRTRYFDLDVLVVSRNVTSGMCHLCIYVIFQKPVQHKPIHQSLLQSFTVQFYSPASCTAPT